MPRPTHSCAPSWRSRTSVLLPWKLQYPSYVILSTTPVTAATPPPVTPPDGDGPTNARQMISVGEANRGTIARTTTLRNRRPPSNRCLTLVTTSGASTKATGPLLTPARIVSRRLSGFPRVSS